MPATYLLHVNSRPQASAGVDDDLWEKWYTEEHVPDMVKAGVAVRAAVYRETHDFSLALPDKHPRRYLALYQSEMAEPLTSSAYRDQVRHTSVLWPQQKEVAQNGDFDARNYRLIQDYDPNEIGEAVPPMLLTVEMDPVDEADMDKWYRAEHLDMLHQLPWYRKSSRYVLGPVSPLTHGHPPK